MRNTPKILIIAGSDSCGGAGLQADIKVATAHKIYAACAPTCLTAQSTVGVAGIFYPPISFLKQQLEVVLDDIKFDAIKIGMLGSVEIIDCVADVLARKAKKIPLILDTVMVSTSGHLLLQENAVEALKSRLVKGAFLVTPNIDEAQVLAQMKIKSLDDMKLAALKIKALGACNVLIKGGHLPAKNGVIKSILLLENSAKKNKSGSIKATKTDEFNEAQNNFVIISNKKIAAAKLHGTGCSLASAIACNIAKKYDLLKATRQANNYVYRAVLANLKIGKGSLVLSHF